MWWLIIILIVALALYVSSRPDQFRIERSAQINAAPEQVFALINDFHAWTDWSPWAKLDPAMKTEFGGSPSGVGATYAWYGNKKVGEGRMELVAAQPVSLLRIKLDFLKPFEAHNMAEFVLQPQAGGTLLTWSMYGPSPFISKLMSLFFSMDKLVGKDFEKGLASLKLLAEK